MRKKIIFALLIVFWVFFSTQIVFAYVSFGRVFAGRIIQTKSTEIEALESSGYNCAVSGITISIRPIGSPAGTPTEYFIPSHVSPKTRNTPSSNKLIIGKYGGKESITCTLSGDPPDTKVVTLDTINFFGISGVRY